MASASQSIMTVSSSVTAGLQIQLKCAPVSMVLYSSARVPGKEAEQGKKAMKLGDCQWEMPGMILEWKSSRMAEKGSGSLGGEEGRRGRR